MHKSKKKSAKIPKPIKVKKEKSEEDRTPQPMSHYVDDRLELVKQIFGSLKPKTITNLAPDFLKENELEEIQELCLNELLGISKKRLLSIINATKCPSDTDSSDDSDVHNIEEHVSLEEISSDSEIEGGAGKSSKKKSSGVNAKGGSKKNVSKNVSEKNENSGQISVLELLELQARARAIRSQLALEPVTKIEVDDDGEADEISSTKSKESQNSNRKERKRKSNEQADSTKISKSNGTATPKLVSENDSREKQQPSIASSKKVKLKRNFRTNTDTAAKTTTQSEEKIEVTPKPKAAVSQNEIKEEKRSRSASPDVIPIVTETVTLMISDSSDEEKIILDKTKPTKKPTVLVTSIEVINPTVETKTAQANKSSPAEMTDVSSDTTKQAEDGEILDETDLSPSKNMDTVPAEEIKNDAKILIDEKESLNKACNENAEKNNAEQDLLLPQIVTTEVSFKTDEPTTTTAVKVENNKTTSESNDKEEVIQLNAAEIAETPVISRAVEEDYDNQNDDVISIEGGDLETEMTEHLVEDSKRPTFCTTSLEKKARSASPEDTSKKEGKPPNETKTSQDDVISLGSSDDELTKASTESWNSRWLKSSKVSKVLATSKLGKRVRDKIKKTKRSKKDSLREDKEADAKKSSSTSTYTSKHELGSIEQYKELLEIQRQQRKE